MNKFGLLLFLGERNLPHRNFSPLSEKSRIQRSREAIFARISMRIGENERYSHVDEQRMIFERLGGGRGG